MLNAIDSYLYTEGTLSTPTSNKSKKVRI